MNPVSLNSLWAACVDRLKDRINNRSFWEALEATCPVAIEGDVLIIGMEPENFSQASHIQQNSNFHAAHQVIAEVFGHPLNLRLIDGVTIADWNATKEREARMAASKAQAPAPNQSPTRTYERTHSGSWDTLYESLSQMYAQTPYRLLPQGRARFANEALYLLVETMDTLYAENPDESTERSLGRILDRIGGLAELSPVLLAFELERLRAWRKASTEG